MNIRARILASLLISGAVAIQSAQAQTFTDLHDFAGSPHDGASPVGGVFMDKDRNLYATTESGGRNTCSLIQGSCGTVVKVYPSGKEKVLYNFSQDGAAGFWPLARVVRDRLGNLYGTTHYGGNLKCFGVAGAGCGTIFKLSPSGKVTILHTFAGGITDGCNPWGGLLLDSAGNLYGTTFYCGANNEGTIFKVNKNGHFSLLHSFAYTDGQFPVYTSLTMDKNGNLYGITYEGGQYDQGVAYMLSSTGVMSVLHSFAGGAEDGCSPWGTLALDKTGNLYGTAGLCGASNDGIVWRVSKSGEETVLYNFTGGADGDVPFAGVVLDAKGNLYGVTSGNHSGTGAVYELTPGNRFSVLEELTGYSPLGDLIRDTQGNLYGTTFKGGKDGWGIVFKLTP